LKHSVIRCPKGSIAATFLGSSQDLCGPILKTVYSRKKGKNNHKIEIDHEEIEKKAITLKRLGSIYRLPGEESRSLGT
jgi:hypothetical protein